VNALAGMTDTAGNAERVLTTPLPIGYNILISQIVLLYIYLLPFQLYSSLGWITIPGTVAAAYIILGIATMGDELENPFGNDVNDLPLDQYCAELGRELDTLMSTPAPKFKLHVDLSKHLNQPLWPLSESGYEEWSERSETDIRSALRSKVVAAKRSAADVPM
jgi:ion channel-forming bestrophin family protein